jgi:hypothetical protein
VKLFWAVDTRIQLVRIDARLKLISLIAIVLIVEGIMSKALLKVFILVEVKNAVGERTQGKI